MKKRKRYQRKVMFTAWDLRSSKDPKDSYRHVPRSKALQGELSQRRGRQLKATEKNCQDSTACSSLQGDAEGTSLVSCAAGVLHSAILRVCAAHSSSTSLLKHVSFPHPAGQWRRSAVAAAARREPGVRQGFTAVTPPGHHPMGCMLPPLDIVDVWLAQPPPAPAMLALPPPSQPELHKYLLIFPSPLQALHGNYQVRWHVLHQEMSLPQRRRISPGLL